MVNHMALQSIIHGIYNPESGYLEYHAYAGGAHFLTSKIQMEIALLTAEKECIVMSSE